MKLKQARKARKLVAFFRAAHGFKPPYSVLLDGTAIQAAINLDVALADEVPKLLGGPVRLLVPKPVVAELHVLGKKFAAAAKYARRLKVLNTEGTAAAEQKFASAADAVVAHVAGGNPERFFVMTEDAALRQRLAALPGLPLLRFARERLVVESSARSQLQVATTDTPEAAAAAAAKAAKYAVTLPSAGSGSERADPSGAAPAPSNGGGEAAAAGGKKRRRPKEPNPLSQKKKKKLGVAAPGNAGGASAGRDGAPSGRRKRRRGGGGGAEAAGSS